MQRKTVNPKTVFDSLRYGFSQAVINKGGAHVFISGQVGVDAQERCVGPDLATQARAAVDNMESILGEVGGALEHVSVLRIYMVNSVANQQAVIAEMLRSRFPTRPPATSWLFISALSRPEWLVEIEAEAVVPGGDR